MCYVYKYQKAYRSELLHHIPKPHTFWCGLLSMCFWWWWWFRHRIDDDDVVAAVAVVIVALFVAITLSVSTMCTMYMHLFVIIYAACTSYLGYLNDLYAHIHILFHFLFFFFYFMWFLLFCFSIRFYLFECEIDSYRKIEMNEQNNTKNFIRRIINYASKWICIRLIVCHNICQIYDTMI